MTRPYRTPEKIERAKHIRPRSYWEDIEIYFDSACSGYWPRPWSIMSAQPEMWHGWWNDRYPYPDGDQDAD